MYYNYLFDVETHAVVHTHSRHIVHAPHAHTIHAARDAHTHHVTPANAALAHVCCLRSHHAVPARPTAAQRDRCPLFLFLFDSQGDDVRISTDIIFCFNQDCFGILKLAF